MHIESWPFISFILLVIFLIIKILWLKKQGIRPNRMKNNKYRSSLWLGVVFFLLLLTWLIELIQPAFQLNFSLLPKWLITNLFHTEFLQIIGAVLISFGLVIFVVTLVHFGSSLRFGLDKNNRGILVTTGIFSLSRNPFFLSIDIYFLGIALMLPSVFQITFTLAAIFGIHFFILKEERFLRENYGEEYREYQHKVRRYF